MKSRTLCGHSVDISLRLESWGPGSKVARCRAWWSDTWTTLIRDTWAIRLRCSFKSVELIILMGGGEWFMLMLACFAVNEDRRPQRLDENTGVGLCSPETIWSASSLLLCRLSCSRIGARHVATGRANFVVQRSTCDLPASAKRKIMLLEDILVGSGVRASDVRWRLLCI